MYLVSGELGPSSHWPDITTRDERRRGDLILVTLFMQLCEGIIREYTNILSPQVSSYSLSLQVYNCFSEEDVKTFVQALL